MSATSRMRSALRSPLRSALLPVVLVFVLVASTTALASPAQAASQAKRLSTAVKIVKNQQGDPYRYGAAGPGRFDCSGLVYYSYRKAGFTKIPRTSSAQARFADRVKRKNMRPGDLMFFHNGGRVYHVAVFVGWKNGKRQMVHSPSSGKRVHRASPWTNQWFAGTLR